MGNQVVDQAARHRARLAMWCERCNIPVTTGPVVDAFVATMAHRQYGVEETWDAFCWFQHGFNYRMGCDCQTPEFCKVYKRCRKIAQ